MSQDIIQTEKKDRGFTLVELLIVIVILGILATVTVFAVKGMTDKAKTNTCAADKKAMEVAVEGFYADTGAYPTNGAALVPSFLRAASPNYATGAAAAGTTGTGSPARVAGDVYPIAGNTNGCT